MGKGRVMSTLNWARIMETCVKRRGSDILLRPGSAPFLRCPTGLRQFAVDKLSQIDIALMVSELLPDLGGTQEVDGYLSFDTPYGDIAWFRVAVFGYPNPSLVLLMRLPAVPSPEPPSIP